MMEMNRGEWDAYCEAMAVDDQEAVRVILQKVQEREKNDRNDFIRNDKRKFQLSDSSGRNCTDSCNDKSEEEKMSKMLRGMHDWNLCEMEFEEERQKDKDREIYNNVISRYRNLGITNRVQIVIELEKEIIHYRNRIKELEDMM